MTTDPLARRVADASTTADHRRHTRPEQAEQLRADLERRTT